MLTTTTRRSIDHAEQQLAALESVISIARAKQLEVLHGVDQAQVCTINGSGDLAEWVAGRLNVSPQTSRALAYGATSESRVLTDALAIGHVTFDRVVATMRLANTGADEATLAIANGVAVHHLARLTAIHREMTPNLETTVFEARRLIAQPDLANTSWNIHGQLPAADGEIVFSALDSTADSLCAASDAYRPTLP